jgi:hypothetical protein
MRGRAAFVCLLAASMIPSLHAAPADPHPFNVRDLIAMDRLSEPVVSADGSHLVFTVSSLDL